jgi:hypothetical protein
MDDTPWPPSGACIERRYNIDQAIPIRKQPDPGLGIAQMFQIGYTG